MGIIAGVIDLFFMIKDESGDAKTVISHGLGAFVPIIVFSFMFFNLDFVQNQAVTQGTFLQNTLILNILLIIVLAVIIHAKSSVFKRARGIGTHETWIHTFLVAGITAMGPYLWPFIEPFIPF